MTNNLKTIAVFLCILFINFFASGNTPFETTEPGIKPGPPDGKYLYVAVPGIRNYLGYGGHGLLVFDMENGHRFVKRIKTQGYKADGTPSNVKGIAVSVPLNSIYISTLESLQRIDLTTEELVWEIAFEGGADRMSISPDGKTMYLPSLEKTFWNVIDCETGNIISKIEVVKRAHNTLYGLSGDHAYLADISSPYLHVTDTKTHKIIKKIGPFGNGIRPFTTCNQRSYCTTKVDCLLGTVSVEKFINHRGQERIPGTHCVQDFNSITAIVVKITLVV